MDKKRNNGIDVLRTSLILMIILWHIFLDCCNLRSLKNGQMLGTVYIYIYIYIYIAAFLVVGVNCFFLVSGYFGIRWNLKKFLKIVFAVYIIFWNSNVIALILKREHINLELIRGFIFPISKYWFIFVYLILMGLSTYLNKFLQNLEIKEQRNLLIILFFLNCIYSFVIKNQLLGTNGGYSIVFAIFLYILGNYIHKVEEDKNIINFLNFKTYVLFGTLNGIFILILVYLKKYSIAWNFYNYNNSLVLLASISLFNFFKNMKNNKLCKLSKLGKYTLYIYIIHTTSIVTESYTKLFKTLKNNGIYEIIVVVLFVIMIYFGCLFVGIILEKIFEVIQKLENKKI